MPNCNTPLLVTKIVRENQGFFFSAKFRQNVKNERVSAKKLSNFQPKKKKSQNFCPQLDSNFSLVAF
jgi:hypothetical protein